jgi:drug/metabolite transporter (DMT)-like permease
VIGPDVLRPAEASTQGALAVVLATLGYAANAVWIRRRLLGVNATLLAGTQNLLAVLLLTPLLLTVESVPDLPSMPARVVLASAALALLSSGVAYVIYYWLLTTLEATQASLVTYLIPLFALSWGALVLDESLPLAALPGLALIAAGMWLVARPRRALVIVPQPIDG